MTPSSSHLRELLLRYLIDEMPPLEREEVDTALIASPEFADSLQDARNDLLDDYTAGRLPADQAARVQQAIAANKSFAQAAQSAAALRLAQTQRRTQRPLRMPRRRRFHLPGWAVAASGVVVIGGLIAAGMWRFTSAPSVKPLPRSITTAAAPGIASLPSHPAAHAPSSNLAASNVAVAPPHRAMPSFAATLLMPETSRSNNATPLSLPPGVRNVRVEWPITEGVTPGQNLTGRTLTLTVFQDDKQVAEAQEERPRRNIDGTPLAGFTLPSGPLQPGVYIFRIAAADAATAAQPPLIEVTVQVSR